MKIKSSPSAFQANSGNKQDAPCPVPIFTGKTQHSITIIPWPCLWWCFCSCSNTNFPVFRHKNYGTQIPNCSISIRKCFSSSQSSTGFRWILLSVAANWANEAKMYALTVIAFGENHFDLLHAGCHNMNFYFKSIKIKVERSVASSLNCFEASKL